LYGEGAMTALRVLIVDDHIAVTEGLTSLLRKHGIEIAAVASSGEEAVRKFDECLPDVVVLDVQFETESAGLQAATEILSRHPQAAIVFYSQFDQDELIHRAYSLGGMGFVTKEKPAQVLVEAIRKVASGQPHFLPEISERLALLSTRGDPSPQAKLDEREMRVFKMIARNMTNRQIVEEMKLSAKTISLITQSIKSKLNAHNNGDLILLAFKYKVLEP